MNNLIHNTKVFGGKCYVKEDVLGNRQNVLVLILINISCKKSPVG